ncbi:MAG: zinc ribbon domain-containing protein, partial [Promethearchaeota archaeon]
MTKCPKCGSENPTDGIYCIVCGNSIKKVDIEFFSPKKSIICPKCGVINPEKAYYCYDCGSSISEDKLHEGIVCSICGISVDKSQLFCPNCGQSIIHDEKNEEITRKEHLSRNYSKQIPGCPACGFISTGDYCSNCGYHLITPKKQSPIDNWYCPRDSALMNEIDPNLQIPISKSNIDESIAHAMNNNLILPYDREKARYISQQLFQEVATNFIVLARVKCPVCGQQSLAPATVRPKHMVKSMPLFSLNGGAILRSGYHYIRKYPKILIIPAFAIIIDFILIFIGLNFSTLIDPTSLLSAAGLSSINLPVLLPVTSENFLPLLIIGLILTACLDTFFLCWYNTSILNIRNSNESSLNLNESIVGSFHVFPRALLAQTI